MVESEKPFVPSRLSTPAPSSTPWWSCEDDDADFNSLFPQLASSPQPSNVSGFTEYPNTSHSLFSWLDDN